MTGERVRTGEVGLVVAGKRFPLRCTGVALAVLAFVASLCVLSPAPRARATIADVGAGIFAVEGPATHNLTFSQGGTYYLTVATDTA